MSREPREIDRRRRANVATTFPNAADAAFERSSEGGTRKILGTGIVSCFAYNKRRKFYAARRDLGV